MDFLRRFLPLFIVTTCLSGLIYLTVQQSLRIGANDPQIQMAEDLVTELSTQKDTLQITTLPRVNISKSLSPFIIVYDESGQVISSSGDLNGTTPLVPRGVLAYAKEHEDDRFTWQPESGVRVAAVVKHFTGRTTGYVLVGRSLREIEKREDSLTKQVGLGYAATVVALVIAVAVTLLPQKKRK